MREPASLTLSLALSATILVAQTASVPQRQDDDEIVRITSELVQTDVVVTDKNDSIISDLRIEEFDLFVNGKRQDIKFLEFVGGANESRTDGTLPPGMSAASIEVARELTAKNIRRVIAFVIDDLTIPSSDFYYVRQMLLDFVDKQMQEGDLVAIVRVFGGKGLLEQFTSDRQLLRRAVNALKIPLRPSYSVENPISAGDRINTIPTASTDASSDLNAPDFEDLGLQDFSDPNNETLRLFRGHTALSKANFVIDSLKQLPGRKSLVIVSAGIPIFESGSAGIAYSNTTQLLNQLTDNAVRAGVVINTLDPRGLKATPGVQSFTATPGRSALSTPDPSFGRGGGSDAIFGPALAGAEEHLGLNTLSSATGGVSIQNTNNFQAGLEKVLARSRGYYLLAFRPTEKFDNKFHKLEIKVKRDDVKIYRHRGYIARVDTDSSRPLTKEEEILAAAKTPLARNDLDVTASFSMRILPTSAAEIGINLLIDPKGLKFTQSPDGKYQTSFDVVGFVYDELGKLRGGFSETINTNLAADNYNEALLTGLTYSARSQLPTGFYQVRAVVRETASGNLGSVSRYVEVPDMTKGRLMMSTIFLHSVVPGSATPSEQLLALRRISNKHDLRYSAIIYNTKLEQGKPKLQSELIVSQAGKVLFREPAQPVESRGNNAAQTIKIGQLGLSKVPPGRYILTLVVTDLLAEKKVQTVSRSIDFVVAK